MDAFLRVVSLALFAWLTIGVPLRGQRAYERLQHDIATNPDARLGYYRRSMVYKWSLALIAVGLYVASGRMGYGTRLVGSTSAVMSIAWPAVVGLLVGALLIRRRLATDAGRARLARVLAKASALLPQTDGERRMFVGVAVTAGITEEILYRGFLLTVLANSFPGRSEAVLVFAAGALFGLAHLYQGAKGVVLTGLVGAFLGTIVVTAGLLPAMVIHSLIDLRVLMLPTGLVAPSDELA